MIVNRRTFLVGLGVFAGSASIVVPPVVFDMGRWMGQLQPGWLPGKPPEWVDGWQPYWVKNAHDSGHGFNATPPKGVEAIIDGTPDPAIPGWLDVSGLTFQIDRMRWQRGENGLIRIRGQWGGLYTYDGVPIEPRRDA